MAFNYSHENDGGPKAVTVQITPFSPMQAEDLMFLPLLGRGQKSFPTSPTTLPGSAAFRSWDTGPS